MDVVNQPISSLKHYNSCIFNKKRQEMMYYSSMQVTSTMLYLSRQCLIVIKDTESCQMYQKQNGKLVNEIEKDLHVNGL